MDPIRPSEAAGSHDDATQALGVGLPVLSSVLGAICQSSCYLPYAVCTYASIRDAHEVLCRRHPNSLCRCARGVLPPPRCSIDINELTDLRDRLTDMIERQTKQQRRKRRSTSDQARRNAEAAAARARHPTGGVHTNGDTSSVPAAAHPMVKAEPSESLLPLLAPVPSSGARLRIFTSVPPRLSPPTRSREPSPTSSLRTHSPTSPRITKRPPAPMLDRDHARPVIACCSPSSVVSPISKRPRLSVPTAADTPAGVTPTPRPPSLSAHGAAPPPLGILQTPTPARVLLKSPHPAHLLPPLINYDAALRANQAQIDALQRDIDKVHARVKMHRRQHKETMQSQVMPARTNTTAETVSA